DFRYTWIVSTRGFAYHEVEPPATNVSSKIASTQMAIRTIGIIVHGATGRIGATQHLKNALTPIRAEGGLAVGEGRVVPQFVLVGRDKERLAAIARENGGAPWTTDLAPPLSHPPYP